MRQEKQKLGHILIKSGILTPYTVARMLRESKHRNKRLGCILEEFGLVTSEELAAVLAQQFDLKQVSDLVNNTYPQELLQIIHVDFALEQIIFPLNMEGRTLHLAIADPTDMKVIDNFAKNNGLLITPYVASRREIYAAISRHYLGASANESRKTTVLLVEDDALLLSATKNMLVKHGYHVVTASDGMEGFREVIASKPQVVVTDSVMPKLDGFALLKSIRASPETSRIPVILISDKLSDEDEAKVFQRGFFDHIPKPFKEVTLVSRVDRAVSSGELVVASMLAKELPWEKREASDRLDDEHLFSLEDVDAGGADMYPSAQPDVEQDCPEAVIDQEMSNASEAEPSPPVTPTALPEMVPSAVEQKSDQHTTPVSHETIQSTAPQPVNSRKDTGSHSDAGSGLLQPRSPVSSVIIQPTRTEAPPQAESAFRISKTALAAIPSERSFPVLDETTAHAEKITEDTLLAFDQECRSHSRRIFFMVAVVLLLIAGGGYLFIGQLHQRSLYRVMTLWQTISGETLARTGGKKADDPARPVQRPLSSPSDLTLAPVRELPSFVPANGRDSSFSTQRPGWERYVDSRRDVRVFRQNGRIKALQVVAAPGQVITEISLKSALRELTGNADFTLVSRERRGNYLLQRSRIGRSADLLLYRKIPAEVIVAFVVSLN